MNSVSSVAVREAVSKAPARSNPTQYLYSGVAFVLLLATALGFQQFYLHGRAYPGRELLPGARSIIIAHGVTMSAWILLFMVQPLLIAGKNRKLHMSLGKAGAVLAAAIVFFGLQVPVMVVRLGPEFPLWGLNRHQFMAIPIFSVLMFGIFVAIGVWYRFRPEIHRPMMLLATLSIIAAATDRITGLPQLYGMSIWGRVFGPYFPALVIGLAFFALKWAVTRKFDRPLAVGYLVLVTFGAFTMAVAPTSGWVSIATYLTS
jgi:hypothetical protein